MSREDDHDLTKKARIGELRANFDAYKQDQEQKDEKQQIGRPCDLNFDFSEDLNRQVNEKFEQIDQEFEKDQDALERQNLQERKDFDDWMKGQREELRSGDITHNPEKAQPRLVPGFDRGGVTGDPGRTVQFDKDYAAMENMRDAASDKMRTEFHEFQEKRHDDRLDKLNERKADNEAQLNKVEEYLEPLPWEDDTKAQERAQGAIEELKQQQEKERDRQPETKEISR